MGRKSRGKAKSAENFILDFGRHRGKRLSQVPSDYLNWILSSECSDNTVKWIVRKYLSTSGRYHRKRNIAQIGKGISRCPQRPSSKAENSPKADRPVTTPSRRLVSAGHITGSGSSSTSGKEAV